MAQKRVFLSFFSELSKSFRDSYGDPLCRHSSFSSKYYWYYQMFLKQIQYTQVHTYLLEIYQVRYPFQVSTAPGHKSSLFLGTLNGTSVVLMQGRFHLYEGYTIHQVRGRSQTMLTRKGRQDRQVVLKMSQVCRFSLIKVKDFFAVTR